MAKSNKMIPLITVSVIAALAVAWVYSNSGRDQKAASPSTTLAAPPTPPTIKVEKSDKSMVGRMFGGDAETRVPLRAADADTYTETLNTLIVSTAELTQKSNQLIAQNEQQARDLKEFRQNQDAREARVLTMAKEAVQKEVAALEARTPPAATYRPPEASQTAEPAKPRASGLQGLSETAEQYGGAILGTGSSRRSSTATSAAASSSTRSDPLLGVVTPVGFAMAKEQGNAGSVRYVRTTLSGKPVAAGLANGSAGPANGSSPEGAAQRDAGKKPPPDPWFTIPENATLAQSVTMTLLVGRVPIDGRVNDPMQFKLVIGRENLAASGHYLPDDLNGIIVSGVAIGDMALSCVEGQVQSLTFVFDDGTIRTVSNRQSGALRSATTQGQGQGGSAAIRKLGWLSTAMGSPCIPGKFVTNAPAYLTDIVGMRALGVAGAAYAASQTTQTASAFGGTSTVTGNRGTYVLGRTVTGATDEVAQWLLARLKNSFDAVVVQAGMPVVVNIDTEIAIDYDGQGRRLDYHRTALNQFHQRNESNGLD